MPLNSPPEAEVAGTSPAGCAKPEQSFSGIVLEAVGTVAAAQFQAVSPRLELSSTRAPGVTGQSCRCVILSGLPGTTPDGVCQGARRPDSATLGEHGERSRRREHQLVGSVRHDDRPAGKKKPDAAHQGWFAPGSRLFCEDGEGATVSAHVTL